MQIEQRHVTTVNMRDGKARDVTLSHDDRGYKVSCVSKDEVVNFLLSPHDFHKLRRQVAKWEGRAARRDGVETTRATSEPRAEEVVVRLDAAEFSREPHRLTAETGEVVPYPWGNGDWLGFN